MMRHTLWHGGHNALANMLRQHALQLVLWTLWTLAIVGTAIYQWQVDSVAHRPFNTLGMVIHGLLVGVVGMIVITNIELWLDSDL